MKGRLGAVLTSGLAAVALALALLQILVLAHSTPRQWTAEVQIPAAPSNRFSAPGGRAGIPWIPFDATKPQPAEKARSPGAKPPGERHAPPPSKMRGINPPTFGPRPARRVAA